MLFALCSSADAQQPKKVPRIGYLKSAASSPSSAFMQGLRDLGYVEGKHFDVVFRTTEGKNERYSDLAAELVRLNVDIIVVGGNTAIRAAKKTTSTIPLSCTCWRSCRFRANREPRASGRQHHGVVQMAPD